MDKTQKMNACLARNNTHQPQKVGGTCYFWPKQGVYVAL
jgi:hypothetical protein